MGWLELNLWCGWWIQTQESSLLSFSFSPGRTVPQHGSFGVCWMGLTARTLSVGGFGEALASSRKMGCCPGFMGSLLLFTQWMFWSVAVFVVRLCTLQPV